MTDGELEAGLAEAIEFHRGVIEALAANSHAARRGRHAQALSVLLACWARLERGTGGAETVPAVETGAKWWDRD